MKLHERTHSNVRPYKCRSCSKAFKTRENLWGHQHRGTCTRESSDTHTTSSSEEFTNSTSFPSAEATVSSNGLTAHASFSNNNCTAQCIHNNHVVARAVFANNYITAEAYALHNGMRAEASIIGDHATAQTTTNGDHGNSNNNKHPEDNATMTSSVFTHSNDTTSLHNPALASYVMAHHGEKTNVSMLFPQTIYTLSQNDSNIVSLPPSNSGEQIAIQQQYQQFQVKQTVQPNVSNDSVLPHQLSGSLTNYMNALNGAQQQICQKSTTVTRLIENITVQNTKQFNTQKLPTLKEFLNKNMNNLKTITTQASTPSKHAETNGQQNLSLILMNGSNETQSRMPLPLQNLMDCSLKNDVSSMMNGSSESDQYSPNNCYDDPSVLSPLSGDFIPVTPPLTDMPFSDDIHSNIMSINANSTGIHSSNQPSDTHQQHLQSCQTSLYQRSLLSIPSPILSTTSTVELPLLTPPLTNDPPRYVTDSSEKMRTSASSDITYDVMSRLPTDLQCGSRDSNSPYSGL